MEKYKELYNLSIKVLNEEQARFNRIDLKASQYLSVLTLLIGVAGFFGKWLIGNLIPPKSELEWILLISGILVFLSILISWFLLFRVIRTHDVIKIPLDEEVIDFFDKNRLIDIYYALSIGMKDALEENRKLGDKKSKRLYYGYTMINITVYLFILFSFLFVVFEWS